MSTPTTISANIRAEAARRRITQKRLAAMIGMSEATWRRRMAENTWSAAEVRLIATALDVQLSVLYGKEAA